MLLEGQQLSHFVILRLLKSGGMGDIYLAEDRYLRRQVAIKVIRPDLVHQADMEAAKEAVRLFLREAQAIARLDHIHILPLYDSGQVELDSTTLMYMVMPFRPEGSLAEWLQRHRYTQLPVPDVASIVQQAAGALQHAHDRQIIHQDVKPANFLIRGDTQHSGQLDLQLTDFGIAKFMTTSGDSRNIRGTPAYVAPEQWEGHPIPATDQYALAMMTYELLVGHVPFWGKPHQVMHMHFNVQPLPPSSFNPAIPTDIDAVLLSALAKVPANRFSSISTFAHAFQQAALSNRNERIVSLADVKTLHPTMPAINMDNGTGVTAQRRRYSKRMAMMLITLVLLVIAGSVGLFYITTINTIHANSVNSTVTAIARVATTAQVNHAATATAQTDLATTATTQANLAATATAQTDLAATATTQANLAATVTAQANLAAAATVQANLTATATAYSATVAVGTPAIDDPLQDNGQGYNWDTTHLTGGGSCSFTNAGTYVANMPQDSSLLPCFAQTTHFNNFSYQVEMTIVTGNQGGIVFRADSSQGSFYYFQINRNGTYTLKIYKDSNYARTISSGTSPAIKTMLNQSNLLTIKVDGDNLVLFVNMQYITTVQDNTYDQGQIGVVAENNSAVIFSNVKVWSR